MTVITISRLYGSGGDEIAAHVCDLLGYPAFDKSLLFKAARESGISEKEVFEFSEDNHVVRSFLDRLFSRSTVFAQGQVWQDVYGAVYALEDLPLGEEEMLTLTRKAILSAYQAGDLVIVGRGSQVVLREVPGVLHVRIVAPMEERIQRVKGWIKDEMGEHPVDVELRRQAQDRIEERDKASADYLRRFFDVAWDDPILYHAVLNTGRISPVRCAQLIAQMAKTI
jgi:CMP/dCMP kinase